MLYAALPGSIWSRNHSRCCANDSGNSSGRGARRAAGAVARWWPPSRPPRASSATVGASNSTRAEARPRTSTRMRDITCVAKSEWPPSSKKWSWRPTRSTRARSLQMLASTSSAPVRGATYAGASRGVRTPAARGGPPCRWASAATRRAPRTPTAPCTRASVALSRSRSCRRVERRPLGHHVGHQPLIARRRPAAPPPRSPPPRAARQRLPRSRRARCGSRAA